MFKMLFPLALIIASNTFYNICTKSYPANANTFVGLTVTYLVAAALSAALFLTGGAGAGAGAELSKLNWTAPVLGLSIVGLEAGFVLLYRAGWKISLGALTANTGVAVALLFVGVLLYRETLTLRQILGMIACAVGLFLLNG